MSLKEKIKEWLKWRFSNFDYKLTLRDIITELPVMILFIIATVEARNHICVTPEYTYQEYLAMKSNGSMLLFFKFNYTNITNNSLMLDDLINQTKCSCD